MTILPKIAIPSLGAPLRSEPAGISLSVRFRQAPSGGGWHHTIIEGKVVPTIYCPKCGRGGYLTKYKIDSEGNLLENQVDLEGTLASTMVCAEEDCDFNDNVKLCNYEP